MSRPNEVKARLAAVAGAQRAGLQRGQDRVVHLDDGFDFLGFNVRRYDGKLLIKPSQGGGETDPGTAAHRDASPAWGTTLRRCSRKINPIVRGWSAYYRTVVSSDVFTALDDYLWRLTYKWAKHSHPNKPRNWVIARYFGRFNTSRQDRWVFGDRDSGAYLLKFSWTKIVRHPMVKGTASPDDPALADYWAERRAQGTHRSRWAAPPCACYRHRTAAARCAAGSSCTPTTRHRSPREWEQWLTVTRTAMTKHHIIPDGPPGTADETRLTHAHCHRRHRADNGTSTTSALPAREPPRLA